MRFKNNRYIDLVSYHDIYRELVYQRNSAISWLTDNGLLGRDPFVSNRDKSEWTQHKIAGSYRHVFKEDILHLLDRLYSHDAIEALYDFESVRLNGWSDTEANWLEREINALQAVISKLEQRYNLQYKVLFQYDAARSTLQLNSNDVLSCGITTLRHRLLTVLFSDTHKQWLYSDISDYFSEHFGYEPEELRDKTIEKTANDLRKDIAAKTAVKDLLKISNAVVTLNPQYVP